MVQAELDGVIELLFRDSESYRLALKLYAGRFEVIAFKPAEEILRAALAEYIPDEQTPLEKLRLMGLRVWRGPLDL